NVKSRRVPGGNETNGRQNHGKRCGRGNKGLSDSAERECGVLYLLDLLPELRHEIRARLARLTSHAVGAKQCVEALVIRLVHFLVSPQDFNTRCLALNKRTFKAFSFR